MLQHKTYKKADLLKEFDQGGQKKDKYIWSYIIRPVRDKDQEWATVAVSINLKKVKLDLKMIFNSEDK